MYLVDTNVVSAGAPTARGAPELVNWMDAHSASLFVSVVTVSEIVAGIAKVRREGGSRKAAHLAAWLDALLHLYGDRVLPIDTAVAQFAGQLSDLARAKGRPPGFADIAIAATARRHGLTILSRNFKHFEPLGVPVLDPFSDLPQH